MTEPLYLTPEGSEKLKQELNHLKNTERIALATRLREAIQMGDLSENADYHKAKEDQAFLEGRIQELEYILANAQVVDSKRRDVVGVGVGVFVGVTAGTPTCNTIELAFAPEPQLQVYVPGVAPIVAKSVKENVVVPLMNEPDVYPVGINKFLLPL